MRFSEKPLVPRNPDGKLFVVLIGRISTERQDIENIDASCRQDRFSRRTVVFYTMRQTNGRQYGARFLLN